MKPILSSWVLLATITFLFNCCIHTKTIGTQVWMDSNLKVTKFRNGDPLFQVTNASDWFKAFQNKQPACCDYQFDSANGTKYGKLYNWYAIKDPRGLGPSDYHVPTQNDWTTLKNYVMAGGNPGAKLKASSLWLYGGGGSNDYGFSALPGGFCDNAGNFKLLGTDGYWWSSTEFSNTTQDAYHFHLTYSTSNADISYQNEGFGMSVRLVKN